MTIGFFDSGVGGITVLKEALVHLPHENFIYYADTDHVPYGTKSKEEVKRCIFEAVAFIAAQKVSALVIACNTATSIAINDLRKEFGFPILGMEPAVKPAVESRRRGRVLVTATPLTLKEEKFKNLVTRLDADPIVDALPLPELVEYAEKFIFDEELILGYLKGKLAAYTVEEYETVVLGCTHFPFYKSVFQKIFPGNTHIIDGSQGTAAHLVRVLEDKNLVNGTGSGQVVFYSSGRKEPENSRYDAYLKILNNNTKGETL